MNGTLQFIFFVYTLIVGIVLSYLIVALTVARMDEVYEKAEILQTVQKVMNIDEISLPFGFRKFIKFDWNSKPPLKFQLPFRGNNLTVKELLEVQYQKLVDPVGFPDEVGFYNRFTKQTDKAKPRRLLGWMPWDPWLLCVKVNNPEGRKRANFFQRQILGQRGDEDTAYTYKLYFYDPINKRAHPGKPLPIDLSPASIRYLHMEDIPFSLIYM